jgi:ubiquinone/menaquinone biosynthesis C-methylase UbiE
MKTLDLHPSPSFVALQQPLPRFSLRNLYYQALRGLLTSVGNLSDGIHLGNQFGFDSGVMLDYVYKNRPSGRLLFGKLIDWFYLNSVGWRGIRLRKELVKEVLLEALADQLAHKLPIHYLDVACGGADYDLDVLQHFAPHAIQAELRDYKQENLDKACENAQRRRVTNVRFQRADAFDPAHYQGPWDVVVVSGFWEIIDDDRLVQQCLQQIARCLAPGAELVFTIQPAHPQLELIARTLTSHTGKPWVMRLRSLALFQHWLHEAGLRYVSHRMEEHGIFGVVRSVKG